MRSTHEEASAVQAPIIPKRNSGKKIKPVNNCTVSCKTALFDSDLLRKTQPLIERQMSMSRLRKTSA
jgi:hypothetical protein